MNYAIKVKDINHNFDSRSMAQLSHINFSVGESEVLSILGPSGTGKTTLLNIIRGTLAPDSGEIEYSFDENLISYVPQESSLNEEISVLENILTGDEIENDRDELINRARGLIEIFALEYKDHKLPKDLSAGQRQRVEFAKALIKSPKLILLDEPFSNLDEFLKDDVISEVFPIFKERNISVVFVSHNIQEAFSVSDRVMILAHGKIQQLATPREVYENPSNVFVARFTGKINLIASNVVRVETDFVVLKNSLGEFEVQKTKWLESKKFVYMAIRPEKVLISSNEKEKIKGRVKRIDFRGAFENLYVQASDKNKLIVSHHKNDFLDIKINQQLFLSFSFKDLFLLAI